MSVPALRFKEFSGDWTLNKVGDICGGEITGIVDFGIFVKIEDGLEGLVHISEVDWTLVENPRSFYKVGEKVNVKIIEVKDGKVSLSIKALKENPWVEAEKKYNREYHKAYYKKNRLKLREKYYQKKELKMNEKIETFREFLKKQEMEGLYFTAMPSVLKDYCILF